jgi:hypothetical protein
METVNSKRLVTCWGTPEPYVDGDTAAAFLGITRRTLLNWARDRKIPGYPLDPTSKKKDWRFKLSELDSHMLNSRLQPPEPPIRRI